LSLTWCYLCQRYPSASLEKGAQRDASRSLDERVSDHARLDRPSAKLRLLDSPVSADVEQAFHLASDLLEATPDLQRDLAVEDGTAFSLAEAAQALLEVWERGASEGGHAV
jgi:hypothetical protein